MNKSLDLCLNVTAKQLEVIQSNADKIAVLAGRGSGKTAITSILAILSLLEGKNVIVIAPTYNQLVNQNFTEIIKQLHLMNLAHIINYKHLLISFKGKKIFFISGMNAERLRGYTEIGTLIFDEAANLEQNCYTLALATMRALNGKKPKVYIVGTPPPNENHWLAQMALNGQVQIIQATAKDNSFVEPDYLDKLKKDYEFLPEDFLKRELYGELIFNGQAAQSLFNDFEIVESNKFYNNEPIVAGLDIAGRGSDTTVMVVRQGKQVLDIITFDTPYDNELKAFVEAIYRAWQFDVLRYDSTGFGHLITFDLPAKVLIQPVNFGAGAGERFANQRTLIYSMLAKERVIYMSAKLYKQYATALIKELNETRYNFERSMGRLNLIDKNKIKERLNGRSPDRADALALAFSYAKKKEAPKAVTAPSIFSRYSGGIQRV